MSEGHSGVKGSSTPEIVFCLAPVDPGVCFPACYIDGESAFFTIREWVRMTGFKIGGFHRVVSWNEFMMDGVIAGFPRSGSTFVSRRLAQHPQICAGPSLGEESGLGSALNRIFPSVSHVDGFNGKRSGCLDRSIHLTKNAALNHHPFLLSCFDSWRRSS